MTECTKCFRKGIEQMECPILDCPNKLYQEGWTTEEINEYDYLLTKQTTDE